MRRIVIAAPSSGSGKTTVTLGIMSALARRGVKVAPFKVGPDFIDPGYHRLATGTASINLDGWICGGEFVRASFSRHCAGKDVAVIEGVMGLFDGIDGVSESGSTAQLAKLLGAPAVLVVDARSQARSAAALLHGFVSFDPELQVAGVIFNNVGSPNHEKILREAVATALPGIAVIGCLPKDPRLAIPSRHLGLFTAEDNPLGEEFLAHLAEVVERHLDLTLLVSSAGHAPLSSPHPLTGGGRGEGEDANEREEGTFPHPLTPSREGRGDLEGAEEGEVANGREDGDVSISGENGEVGGREEGSFPHPLAPSRKGRGDVQGAGPGSSRCDADQLQTRPLPFKGRDRVRMGSLCEAEPVRIAVARDAAFCFVYEDNLQLLEEQGAELCHFSPLKDGLPADISGIYLPGGYPELFAPILAANQPLKEAIHCAADAGMPIYAECGGFIYLTAGVETDGILHPFVGLFPVRTRMLPRRKALGYREIELAQPSLLGDKGTVARGHEFHYSEMEEMPETVERLYLVSKNGAQLGLEGFRYKNCLASYIHLHFGSSPGSAASFVGHCRAFRERSLT